MEAIKDVSWHVFPKCSKIMFYITGYLLDFPIKGLKPRPKPPGDQRLRSGGHRGHSRHGGLSAVLEAELQAATGCGTGTTMLKDNDISENLNIHPKLPRVRGSYLGDVCKICGFLDPPSASNPLS